MDKDVFLMIDNYDSFVYNLVMYFKELNENVEVHRNDKIDISYIKDLNPKGIILSPGPKSPKEAGICLEVIDEFKGNIPILGICLGHQCIAQYFGADIVRAPYPMHGKISKIAHNGEGVFKNIKQDIAVTRYHSLMIDEKTMQDSLDVTAKSYDKVIMGIRHKEFNIHGVQFHPEAVLTECGHEILKNFIDSCK